MINDEALLIVDVQNDFCPGGALAVNEGETVVPVLNRYIEIFTREQWPIIASRDWHPAKTKHFKDFGGIWPVHCVQNTPGAAFHPDLHLPREAVIVSKGMDPEKDSYSAFQACDVRGRRLLDILQDLGVKELFVGGLATDYCVKATVLDGLRHFKVNLLTDAIKGVNKDADDAQKAVNEMCQKGAQTLTLADL